MYKFILRRVMMLPLVLLGVSFILFLLTQTMGPEMRASLYIQDPRQMDSMEDVIQKYGLRDSVFKQYGRWLSGVVKGDLGFSQTASMPVSKAIKTYLPATFELAFVTIILVFITGVWLGAYSAVKKGHWQDRALRLLAISAFSVPLFVLGLVLLMIFYGKFGLFGPGRYSMATDFIVNSPTFNSYTGLLLIDTLANFKFKAFFDVLSHLFLPAVTLCIGSYALMFRVMRGSMLEELGKDYVRTARAKGLSERSVVYKHAARNAMIPVVTLLGIQFIRLLGGTVIVETIFNYPGIGRFAVTCAQQLDIPGVLGFSMVVAVLFVIGNLVIDIAYTALDPRIRLK
ncbi:peptide/nickel transport system permease protein [Parelusimicrobium proximum]|uniref:ABC transporter permease n=1 Tax=Parelusimicrobium proximum TaxID=3228953 RepID=UPI003D1694FB